MKKKMLCLLLVFLLSAGTAFAAEPLTIQLNGVEQTFDVPPILLNNRTMIPLRGVAELLGAEVGYEASTRRVNIRKGDTELTLTIDSTSMIEDGLTIQLDTPPIIRSNRTLVPARFIAERLDTMVIWNPEKKVVLIIDPVTLKNVKNRFPKIEDYLEDCLSIEKKLLLFDEEMPNMATVDMIQGQAELEKEWQELLDEIYAELKTKGWNVEEKNAEWLKQKEKRIQEAGREFEGGSLQRVIQTDTSRQATQERVYELLFFYLN